MVSMGMPQGDLAMGAWDPASSLIRRKKGKNLATLNSQASEALLERHGLGSWSAVPLMSCVILGKLLKLSEPLSPHLGMVRGPTFHEIVRINELMSTTSLE